MDQKRLFAAIAMSIGILLIFDVWNRTNRPPAPLPTGVFLPSHWVFL